MNETRTHRRNRVTKAEGKGGKVTGDMVKGDGVQGDSVNRCRSKQMISAEHV